MTSYRHLFLNVHVKCFCWKIAFHVRTCRSQPRAVLNGFVPHYVRVAPWHCLELPSGFRVMWRGSHIGAGRVLLGHQGNDASGGRMDLPLTWRTSPVNGKRKTETIVGSFVLRRISDQIKSWSSVWLQTQRSDPHLWLLESTASNATFFTAHSGPQSPTNFSVLARPRAFVLNDGSASTRLFAVMWFELQPDQLAKVQFWLS